MIPWEIAAAIYLWAGMWLSCPMTASGPLSKHPTWVKCIIFPTFLLLWGVMFPIVVLAKERAQNKAIAAFRAKKAPSPWE